MNRLARRALLLQALQDLVQVERDIIDRNRYGDGRPGAAVAELAGMLDQFDRLGGFDGLWLDIWPTDDTPAIDPGPGPRPPDASSSERLRTAPDSHLGAPNQILRTAPNGSERLRTAASHRWQRW